MPRRCSFKLETRFPEPLAGVDEAGCAPLAGPVVAAAVILNRDELPARHRRFARICRSTSARRSTAGSSNAPPGASGIASVEEIDTINIYWARMLAMSRAVEALGLEPAWVLVDGNACSALAAAVEGDRRRRRQVPLDRRRLDHRQGHPRPDDGRPCRAIIPATAGRRNRGYPTARSPPRAARARADPAHRRSFGLVREMLRAKRASRARLAENAAGESSAPHHHRLSPVARRLTQHLVVGSDSDSFRSRPLPKPR